MLVKSISTALILSGCLLSAGLAAGSAAHACDLRLGSLTVTPLSYDPFAFRAVTARAEVEVALLDAAPCSFSVRLLDDAFAPLDRIEIGDREKAVFDIRPFEQGGARIDAAARGFQVDLSAERPKITLRWDLVLTQDAVLRAGDYRQPLAVAVRAPSSASDQVTRGEFRLTSLSRAEVNIAGASGNFGSGSLAVIDFGNLVSGAQRRAFVQVRSNTPVMTEVTSKNHGVMINETMPQAEPITYHMVLNGQPVALDHGAKIPLDPPLTVDGVSLPMDLTIGDVSGKMAGRYSDILTIDVSPR